MYHQGDGGGGWQKSGIEGPAYLVQRGEPPLPRLWVTSRVGQRALYCDLDADVRCSVNGHFMLFEGGGGKGPRQLWYPDEDAGDGAALYAAFSQCCAEARRAGGAGGNTAGKKLLAMIKGGEGAAVGGGGAPLPISVQSLFDGAAATAAGGASGAAARAAPSAPPPVVPAAASQQATTGVAAAALPSSVASLFGLAPGMSAEVADKPRGGGGSGGGGASGGGARGVAGRAAGGGGGGLSGDVVLTKEALRAALLELLEEDAFVGVIHARYLQTVAKGKAAGGRK